MFKGIQKRILTGVLGLTMIFSSQTGVIQAADSTTASKETKVYTDELKSGKYELTVESYPEQAMMKMPAIIEIDTQEGTFVITDNREEKEGIAKGSGNITFHETTGDYTLTYTADTTEGVTSTITYTNHAITFTSPMYFGTAKMNVLDDDGNFIPYTAKLMQGDDEKEEGKEEEEGNEEGEVFKEGTYTGTLEKYIDAMESTVYYDVTAAFFDGAYTYAVEVTITGKMDYSSQEIYKGTYTVNGDEIILEEGNLTSAKAMKDDSLTVTGKLSSFGGSNDSIELVWTSAQKPDINDEPDDSNEEDVIYSFTEGAQGNYSYGEEEDYVLICDGKWVDFVEVRIDNVVLDKEYYTVTEGSTILVISGIYLKTLSVGDHTIKLFYTDGTSPEAVLHVAGEQGSFNDSLKSGAYALTEDSYAASAMMKIPAMITIDTDAMTFVITDNREATKGELKGSGTISFDRATGVYTLTYTAGVATTGVTSTVTYADNAITFISPMYFGSARMNVTDEDGRFLPYTANLISGDGSNVVSGLDTSDSDYMILEGGNGTVAQISYRLRCNGSLEKFIALYIDGALVDEANYTKSSGSTVIEISADYMKSLAAGKHIIRLVYTDGSVETTLTVREASAAGTTSNPKTGDNSHRVVWLALVSIGSFTMLYLLRKRKGSEA